ncbi:hypothetical protein ACS0TY_015751 [Phlomoides rotata]
MECEDSPPSTSPIKCCNCNCNCVSVMKKSLSATCFRSVKRKYDEFEEDKCFSIPGFIIPQNARVEIENECMVLREMVSNQQQTIQDLFSELEEERNAASSAANEAMSMILRLQRDKAEIQLEARQFKRFAEEKMAHDQEEALLLEDMLYKREEIMQSLSCEVEAYRHRMMSYGLTEAEADGDGGTSQNNSMIENFEGRFDFPPYEYPPLKCDTNGSRAYPNVEDETPDIEKYAFGETPRPSDQLKDLEYRINQLEKSPRAIHPDGEFNSAKNVLEKVIVGHSPRAQRHVRKFSADPTSSPFSVIKEMSARYSPKFGSSFKKTEFSYIEEKSDLGKMENASEVGDDPSDRVYTIDSVHQGASINGLMSSKASVGIDGDLEIQKLYARLHALEADRESMRQAIISIGTEKAQVALLKEIAQNLCKEVPPLRRMPVRKPSLFGSFSFFSIFKWIIPILFLRKKVRRCKYMFGLSANNAGLLVLLDRSPRLGQWRCINWTNK